MFNLHNETEIKSFPHKLYYSKFSHSHNSSEKKSCVPNVQLIPGIGTFFLINIFNRNTKKYQLNYKVLAYLYQIIDYLYYIQTDLLNAYI